MLSNYNVNILFEVLHDPSFVNLILLCKCNIINVITPLHISCSSILAHDVVLHTHDNKRFRQHCNLIKNSFLNFFLIHEVGRELCGTY